MFATQFRNMESVSAGDALAYVQHVAQFFWLPHFIGTAAFYMYAFRDYQKELRLEADAKTNWADLKHEHAFPLHKEEGGVRGAYRRILPQVLFIDLIVGPILALLWGWVPLVVPAMTWSWDTPLWSFAVGALRVFCVGMLYETILTTAHLIMHTNALYPLTHKMHHMGPQCALAGTYMTAYETAFNGAGLSFLIAGLMGFPAPVVILLAVLGRLNLGKVHSGWREIDTNGPPEAAFHGVHHMKMTGKAKTSNYGSAQWLDKLLGTYTDPKTVFPESFASASGATGKVSDVDGLKKE